jgi:hypothetical protein
MGDAKTRSLITNETIALTLKSIIQFNNNQADEGTVYNCVSAIYSMSKLSHLQEMSAIQKKLHSKTKRQTQALLNGILEIIQLIPQIKTQL